ncbi:MAG: NUDIX hydrolase [Rhodobacteraceae bacterium]|nr:NUDIX hydrolase [Paracoccaceae bacterium]
MKNVSEGKGDRTEAASQTGALCYRVTKKRGPEVLLVTSRDTGRWVIPKGWMMKGKTPAEAALREAFEEAGVEGKVVDDLLGVYSYDKVLEGTAVQPCVVAVYPVAVARLISRFPERGQRERRWFKPKKAARKVAEPELSALLAGFAPGALGA